MSLFLDFLSVFLLFAVPALVAALLVALHDALARWWHRGVARRQARLHREAQRAQQAVWTPAGGTITDREIESLR